jgi:hypothetical protein
MNYRNFVKNTFSTDYPIMNEAAPGVGAKCRALRKTRFAEGARKKRPIQWTGLG